ncbi:MAG: hypothetical protein U5K54_11295 [Cytophagales bacterium]|nr:hypothetical protein [Cytophagales bacterium]
MINKDGYIVTNNHVVDGADVVQVTLSDNREVKSRSDWRRSGYRSSCY